LYEPYTAFYLIINLTFRKLNCFCTKGHNEFFGCGKYIQEDTYCNYHVICEIP